MPLKIQKEDFPGGPVAKKLPANAGDMGSIPVLRRSHMPQSIKTCTWMLMSFVYNSFPMETTHMSINRGMNEQNVKHWYNGMPLTN